MCLSSATTDGVALSTVCCGQLLHTHTDLAGDVVTDPAKVESLHGPSVPCFRGPSLRMSWREVELDAQRTRDVGLRG